MSHNHQHHGNETRTRWAALLTGGFMLAELVGGLLTGSLALLADAAHMLTDSASLALAWLGFRLARRPADRHRTYGFGRFQILVAFANGIILFLLTIWIAVEAARRLMEPVAVLGGPMLVVAALGLVVNIAAFFILHGADRGNLNIRGATLHVLGDLLGSVAALLAAGMILWRGWLWMDPLLSVLVAALILKSAWQLITESGHILLEGTPRHLDVREIGPDLLAQVPGVADVHHVHAWSLTQEQTLVTLHARLHPGSAPDETTARIHARLAERFAVEHATVQIEHGQCRT
jgi:cobalt-zinc-cadmium efflux system protein